MSYFSKIFKWLFRDNKCQCGVAHGEGVGCNCTSSEPPLVRPDPSAATLPYDRRQDERRRAQVAQATNPSITTHPLDVGNPFFNEITNPHITIVDVSGDGQYSEASITPTYPEAVITPSSHLAPYESPNESSHSYQDQSPTHVDSGVSHYDNSSSSYDSGSSSHDSGGSSYDSGGSSSSSDSGSSSCDCGGGGY